MFTSTVFVLRLREGGRDLVLVAEELAVFEIDVDTNYVTMPE